MGTDDIFWMPPTWTRSLIERLAVGVNADGSWGYAPGRTGNAEATALACLALATHGAEHQKQAAALSWMASIQKEDGGVPVLPDIPSPSWPTALAVIAWLRSTDPNRTYGREIDKACSCLLGWRAEPVKPDSRLFGHDTTLIGWSWVPGTHSWVEPTGYAVLALRAAGKADHPRVREAVTLLRDRAIPAGGWNYGNTRVIDNMLRPFPATTGVVLTALSTEEPDASIEAAIKYLGPELDCVRSPLSLGWGVVGLKAWDRHPAAADGWLEESAAQLIARDPNPLHEAMLLLAAAEVCPFLIPVA